MKNLFIIITIIFFPFLIQAQCSFIVNLGSDTLICSGDSIVLDGENSDSSTVSYAWNTGDTSQLITTGIGGIFWVDITINGCTERDSIFIGITNLPNISIDSFETVCEGTPSNIYFTIDDTTDVEYIWNYGNGLLTTDSIITQRFYSSAGTYDVTLQASKNGCLSTIDSVTIPVLQKPSVNISTTQVCVGTTTIINNNSVDSVGASYQWTFGDGNSLDTSFLNTLNYNYASSDSFYISTKIINVNGCTDTDSILTYVAPVPNAALSIINDTICENEPLLVLNTSTGSAGSLTSFFTGDGGSIIQNTDTTEYYYSNFGSFQVTINLDNGICSEDMAFDSVYVKETPNINLSTTTVCFGDTTIFSLQLTDTLSPLVIWNYGDNTLPDTLLSNQNSHYYNGNGLNYTTIINVQNENGCSLTDTFNTMIDLKPTLDFAIGDVCQNEPSIIINNSIDTFQTAYTIDFGDNNTNQFIPNSYVYDTSGSYTVTILGTNDNNCPLDTFITTTTVKPIPSSNFNLSANNICFGDSILFTNNSIGINSTKYTWDFDDNTIIDSTTNQLTYFYSINGNIVTPKLIVDNQNGCLPDTSENTLVINTVPVLHFDVNPVCYGDSTNIINLSSGVGDATEYIINFGDGTVQTRFGINTVKYLYNDDGSYPISISVNNQNGCATPTYGGTSIVKAVPVANFSAATVCFGDSTIINDNSFDVSDSTASYSWDFDDGEISDTIANSFKHLFDNGNGQTYQVSLTIDNNNGCADSTFILPIQVDEKPTALMKIDTAICEPQLTTFINQSTNVGTYTTLLLNYNDGTPIDTINYNQDTLYHSYSTAQVYYISLTVDNNNTCPIDTFLDTTELKLTPVIDWGVNTVCYDNPTVFTDASSHLDPNYNVLYYLNHGDGFIDTLTPFNNYAYTYGYNGKDYTAVLTIDNRRGCTTADSLNISVLKRPYLNYTVDTVCQNLPNTILNLTNDTTVTDSALYNIFYGDGTDSVLSHRPFYNHTFDTCNYFLPYYNITINIDNGNSCTDAINFKPAFVYCLPDVFFTGLESEYCFNDPFDGDNLIGIPQGGTFYPQNLFDPQIDTLNQTWAAYHPTDTGNNILVAYEYTDINNCTVTDSQFIDVVRTLPTFQINGLPSHLCKEDSSITISATIPGGVFNSNGQNIYIIDDTLSFDSIATFNPIAPTNNGQVFYNYQDTFGCANVQVQPFVVYDLPDVYLGNDTVVPFDGLPINLGAGVGSNYTYTWSNGLSTPTIQAFNPGYYTLTINDAFPQITCTDSDTILVDIGTNSNRTIKNIGLKVYPNPVKEILNLDIDLPISEELQIRIFDMTGREISQKQVYINENIIQNVTFDMTNYPSGQYFINVRTSNNLIWQIQIQKI